MAGETLRIGPGVPEPARRRGFRMLAAVRRGLAAVTDVGVGLTVGMLIGLIVGTLVSSLFI